MEHVRAFIAQIEQRGGRPGAARPVCSAWRSGEPEPSGVYLRSVADVLGATFFLARDGRGRFLVCWGDLRAASAFEGEGDAVTGVKVMPCTTANVRALHRTFAFTAPVRVLARRTTIGTGDRLGVATPGHIRAVRGFDATPVLAQQSQRELTLAGRTFPEVIAAASWGVFGEHFTRGYAADADHLKTEADVAAALGHGATMITLDCSEHIDAAAAALTDEEALRAGPVVPAEERQRWEQRYLGREHAVRGIDGRVHRLRFTAGRLARTMRAYGRAIGFTRRVYSELLRAADCDLELSVDETPTPTDPAAHYVIAAELAEAGVRLASLAPRFVGEFQKAIDYIGDRAEFERDFAVHAAVADHFGYKLSIHSGSDKFAVYPVIGRYTGGRVHVKTAGTSWLEAVRVIAITAPGLFRELHAQARASFADAARYYVVGLSADALPTLDGVDDERLATVLDAPAQRQMLHITYGAMLSESGGNAGYRARVMRTLDEQTGLHAELLERHIGRHLRELGVAVRAADADED